MTRPSLYTAVTYVLSSVVDVAVAFFDINRMSRIAELRTVSCERRELRNKWFELHDMRSRLVLSSLICMSP